MRCPAAKGRKEGSHNGVTLINMLCPVVTFACIYKIMWSNCLIARNWCMRSPVGRRDWVNNPQIEVNFNCS